MVDWLRVTFQSLRTFWLDAPRGEIIMRKKYIKDIFISE
jgi:hypothetical protein